MSIVTNILIDILFVSVCVRTAVPLTHSDLRAGPVTAHIYGSIFQHTNLRQFYTLGMTVELDFVNFALSDDGPVRPEICRRLHINILSYFRRSVYIVTSYSRVKRLWWYRGSVLDFGTHVCGFKPGRSRRIFQGEKILSTPSFGAEVKPFVPCRRFTACKRSLNVTWKSGIFRQNSSAISRPSSSSFHY